MSSVIRISKESYKYLVELSNKTDISVCELANKAVESLKNHAELEEKTVKKYDLILK